MLPSAPFLVDECMNLLVSNLKGSMDRAGKQQDEVGERVCVCVRVCLCMPVCRREVRHLNPPSKVEQLQKALIACISVVFESAADLAQKAEAFDYLVDSIKKEKDGEKARLLLKALKPQLLYLLSLSSSKDYSVPLIDSLLSIVSISSRSARLSVQSLLHLVLTHDNALSLLHHPSSSPSSSDSETAVQLRTSLFKLLTYSANEPDNISAIMKNLSCLLAAFREREVGHSLPLLFGLQEIANDCGHSNLARSIHTAIGSYLFSIARMFSSRALHDYVLQTMERRKKENQVCARRCASCACVS